MTRVEEVVVAVGPLVCAVERLAFAPAAAGDDERRRLRFGRAMLDYEICAIGYELRIDTEDGRQCAFHLRGSIVLGLEAADGGVDERAEDGKIGEEGGTDAEVCLHDGLMQIVAANASPCFWYLLRGRGGYDAGAVFRVEEMDVRKWMAASAGLALLVSCETLQARQGTSDATAATAAARQTETDEYTRYELLAPDSASFRIRYEVTAATAGAKYYYNPIRKGSVASDEAVYDAMSGEALQFDVVRGEEARKDPLMADADAGTNYIKVHRARPVPKDGQGRLQDQHVPARLILYTGFGHPITKPKSNRAVMQANLDWFNHYIWGEEFPKDSALLGSSEVESAK